ncbi:MAG: TatD family hydrolase [Rubritalea sp.]|uniref:TatD family hydrolase n=1 Tax=Rubritalea sp. TaxID=2109375 RepID=UPI003242B76F
MLQSRLQDAHLHLQSPRLMANSDTIVKQAQEIGVKQMVVNGTSPDDWDEVSELAHRYPEIITPSFGLHPWRTPDVRDGWKEILIEKIDSHHNSCIGECGLDRWMTGLCKQAQEDAFIFQLQLASESNLPISIHILKAWGWLLETLEKTPTPPRGFLLHSFSGSAEVAKQLAKRGAYFSFSGYFLRQRKMRVQETFRSLPRERILIETDAPHMNPPTKWICHPLANQANHPANLGAIFAGFAEMMGENKERLAEQLELNFQRFFKE